ncbi:hypothetical protein H0I69_06715 [Yersinia enterocolitica]|uniref:hypothetical protein n=1 Tax=Yersinia enterocolitica TaxID=630 RepID=UPI001CA4D433|nr:hypothetical protein [Yersinia enterocolitica]MBW5867506.1 hypothetical protein [Yersinia enterocolitica]
MIAVYCSKIAESGLPAWVPVLIGTAVGAVITGLISCLLQRQAHNNMILIENRKNKAAFINQYVMKDIFSFLDQEINYLQQLSGFNYIPTSDELNRDHRKELARIQTLIKLLDDRGIYNDFHLLLAQKINMENYMVNKGSLPPYTYLGEAMELAAKIKTKISTAA